MGRRIVRSVYASGSLDYRLHCYYNENWQLLEGRKEVSGTEDTDPLNQYLWHPYYIDALAVRYYDSDTDGSGIVNYYYLQDANYNVTAVVDNTGAAVERYRYTPYGDVSFMTGSFGGGAAAASAMSISTPGGNRIKRAGCSSIAIGSIPVGWGGGSIAIRPN